MQDDTPSGEGAPWRTLIGLAVVVLCLLGGWFVWHKVAQMSATQNCVASGRRDCLQIPAAN